MVGAHPVGGCGLPWEQSSGGACASAYEFGAEEISLKGSDEETRQARDACLWS